jgi:hypothetical protein
MVLIGSETLSGGKKVPLRKDIGTMTKTLKVCKSSWDLTVRATKTPKNAKTRHEISSESKNKSACRGGCKFVLNFVDKSRPATVMVKELINPRTTPEEALPTIMADLLIGAISSSSKHL